MKTPPKGPINLIRRKILPKCAQLCAFAGLMILGVWVVGQVLTDRFSWSQYLWWLPAIWMIGLAWMALGVSALLGIFSRRLGGVFLRPLLFIMCIGCTIYLIFGVWHMHRAILPRQGSQNTIRIAQWNQAARKINEQDFAQYIFDQGVDITLISNAHWGDDRQAILDQLAPYAPGDQRRWVNYNYRVEGDPAHFWILGDALIASRFPMTRSGMVRFGSNERQQVFVHSSSSSGWVLFIEFDLLGDESLTQDRLVVWLVDLPSNPSIHRVSSFQNVRRAIDRWDGIGWIKGRHVWEQVQVDEPFPKPDLIVGDFNTPRGSDSLHHLAPNMTDAFSAVGYGRGRSWTPRINNRFVHLPIKLADWHIDLSLVGKDWKPVEYYLKDGSRWGSTKHQIQILEISPVLYQNQD